MLIACIAGGFAFIVGVVDHCLPQVASCKLSEQKSINPNSIAVAQRG
jgi:hypothetical protein